MIFVLVIVFKFLIFSMIFFLKKAFDRFDAARLRDSMLLRGASSSNKDDQLVKNYHYFIF